MEEELGQVKQTLARVERQLKEYQMKETRRETEVLQKQLGYKVKEIEEYQK